MSEERPLSNKHIEDYLDYYLSLSHSPKFAILLKGAWGTGKTWFINQYRHKLKKEKKKPLYVSLYGVTNYSEIEDSLFQQLNPILASEGMVLAGTVFKGLLKTSLNIDLNNDGNNDGTLNFSIPDIDFKKFKDSKYSILIFDDLERCSIPIENILGYINKFVESGDVKVIIIANEDEIDFETSNYMRTKEKLIGKTFEIHLDIQAAFKDFLTKLKNGRVQDILLKEFDLIERLYKKGECKNLRILNQIILDFERIFKKLPEKAQNKSELIQEILQYLTIFTIEVFSGRLKTKEISQIQDKLNAELSVKLLKKNSNKQKTDLDLDSNEQKIDLDKIFNKYKIYNSLWNNPFNNIFPSLLWWQLIFDKGIINKKMLNEDLLASKYFQDKNIPNWIKLWHFMDLTDHKDEIFNQLLNNVESEYESREFRDLGIIKHITGMFLFFSGIGLYKKNKQDIVKNAKKYIDELKDSECLDINYRDYGIGKSYMNLSFMEEDKEEFQKVSNYIKQSQKEAKKLVAPDKAKELLNIMKDDVIRFGSIISIKSYRISNELEYHYFPIFSYMCVNNFVESILYLPLKDQHRIFGYIGERFAFLGEPDFSELAKELDFFKEVQELLIQKSEQAKGTLSGYFLRVLNERYLAKVITTLQDRST